jgi:TPR repeat protein|tara:strand:- start:599 stop:1135 length:537 start_codon:yes stop_codon:yes gene_type:complete
MTKNNILIAFLFSFILVSNASADYNDGVSSYNSGNYEGALNEWTEAAEDGDARSQYNVGWMHANGKGTVQDFQEAVAWYTKSAEQGHINSQYNLGNLHLRGNGTAQNDNLAFSWFLSAAEQGDAPAQYNLAAMYLNGKGGDKNILEARFWCKQAMENNDAYIGALAEELWESNDLGSY